MNAEEILDYWMNSDFSDGAEFERMRALTKDALNAGLPITESGNGQRLKEWFVTYETEFRDRPHTQMTHYQWERSAHRAAGRMISRNTFRNVKLIERNIILVNAEEIDIDPTL